MLKEIKSKVAASSHIINVSASKRFKSSEASYSSSNLTNVIK